MLSPDPSPVSSARESGSWQAAPPKPEHSATSPCKIESTALLQGSREILIAHAGQEYRLRLTRNDKLILTK